MIGILFYINTAHEVSFLSILQQLKTGLPLIFVNTFEKVHNEPGGVYAKAEKILERV